MGNKAQSKSETEQIESEAALRSLLKFQSHEFLVFGFIRMQVGDVPHDLVQLIISYYNVGTHAHIALWCGSEERTSMEYNQVHILNIKNYKKYKLSIFNLDNAHLQHATKSLYFDRLDAFYCSVSGVKLPRWVLEKETAKQHISRHKKYHILFRVGGALKYDRENAMYHNQMDMLVVDQSRLNAIAHRSMIDAYFCAIPTSTAPHLSYFQEFDVCFNNNYLIFCGLCTAVHGGSKPHIKRLDLQTLTWDDDENIRRKLKYPRSGVTCCMMKKPSSEVNKRQDFGALITVGGLYDGEVCNVVETYSFDDNKSETLGLMKRPRFKPGAVYMPFSKQLVVVGGQSSPYATQSSKRISREIEVFDADVGKWRLLGKKCLLEHVSRPLVWNDEMNYNILYIAGETTVNAKRGCVGGIEVIDTRDPNNWNIFDQRDLISLLELNTSSDVFNDWTARAGLVI